jgi:hypothetical protein
MTQNTKLIREFQENTKMVALLAEAWFKDPTITNETALKDTIQARLNLKRQNLENLLANEPGLV